MALTIGPIFRLTGLILSLPGLIDNTIDYAIRLRDKIDTFENAGIILRGCTDEYKIYSNQLKASLYFVKDISQFLSPLLNETLTMAVSQLNTVLAVAKQLAEQAFDSEGKLRRFWFTLYGKSALEKSLREVNRYHDLFLRSLHYAVLFGSIQGSTQESTQVADHLDQAPSLAMVQKLKVAIVDSLKEVSVKKLRIKSKDFPAGSIDFLCPGSNIRCLKPSDPHQQVILIEKHYENTGSGFILQKFEDLARILSGTSLEMGLLPCRGFVYDPQFCELIFPIPNGTKVFTLRELLTSPINKKGLQHSLTDRVNLAVQLATAVMYVHMAKLVHKNIRPENILILEPDSDETHSKYPYALGAPVLMGFDFARFETDLSDRRGTDQWEKNIYMHPERQGDHLEASYNMRHDIYSLGVVLLELALWQSFVLVEESQQGIIKYKPNPNACRFLDKNKKLKEPKDIQDVLIKKTENYVPLELGEKYRDVILLCLKCLDGGFDGTEDMLDADGVIVGLVFIQKVLGALKEISI